MNNSFLSHYIAKAINEIYFNNENEVDPISIVIENPPNPQLGDYATPLFGFAKSLKSAPAAIAQRIKEWFDKNVKEFEAVVAGPYLNLFVKMQYFAKELISQILEEGDKYGHNDIYRGKKIMIEFSCPNTNKPLHLGHLRNDSLGESVSRILKVAGAEVYKVNLINDRGIHICKSMLAYSRFGQGKTPQSENRKSDHFVGDYYVRFDKWAKEEQEALGLAQQMLVKWEQGDKETVELWKLMNEWTVSGINETYKNTGISFDKIYYESQTYQAGREQILKGLDEGLFYKDEEGTVWVDLTDIGLDKKVLLRKDGTTLYLTQDIGTAIARHTDYPFDSLIYVVASEQQYHFKVLFHVLSLLGYEWASQLYHLSYGMVNLPEGKMKSREGTVVDADDLFLELSTLAAKEIVSKGRENEVEDVEAVSKAIALGALNYYLLATTPSKDMIFNPKETISFQGNTGPYAQYMGARISSLILKYKRMCNENEKLRDAVFDGALLTTLQERQLIKLLGEFPKVVLVAAKDKNPSVVVSFLYELCKTFSRFYHDLPILANEDYNLISTRIEVSKGVLQVIKNCFELLGIPFLDKM